MPLVRRLLLLASASAFLATSVVAAEEPVTGGSFFDAFNSLDFERRWLASDGWTNGPHQGCEWRKENLSVSDGKLSLSMTKGSDQEEWNCAELQSNDVYGYGVYEISMRPVAASGTVSAFFTYIGPVHGKPHDEIDFEFLGRDTSRIQLNYFTGGRGGNEFFVPAGEPDGEGFVRLAFEWTPTRVRWFVNGELVHETAAGAQLPVNPSKIYVSLWSGTEEINGWLGPFEGMDQQATLDVQWVAYTAPGESCRFPASITCGPMPE